MLIRVRVIPNASQEKVQETPQCLRVYVCSAPEKGKANRRVIGILSKHLKVKKSALEIVKGLTSKDKVIRVG
jgi:uncharacterized protein